MSEDMVAGPDFPLNSREVWGKLSALLSEERGYRMTLQKVALITGEAISTTAYRLGIANQSQVPAFLCLVERLSDEQRARFLRQVCRTLPTVLHPRLAHDPVAVENLIKLLRQAHGLTFIHGAASTSRFVLTALGHTFCQLDARHSNACGIDAQPPKQLVPLENVFYCRDPLSGRQLREAVQKVWPKIQTSSSRLMLFNDLWSTLPELQPDILALAKKCHVILADSQTPNRESLLHKVVLPFCFLSVSQMQDQNRIRIACEASGMV